MTRLGARALVIGLVGATAIFVILSIIVFVKGVTVLIQAEGTIATLGMLSLLHSPGEENC